MAQISSAAATVLAGIFHIHGQAAQVFQQNLAGQTAMAAGARGGNQNFALRNRPNGKTASYLRLEAVARQIKRQCVANRVRLFVDFAQHLMSKARHFPHLVGLRWQAKVEPDMIIY
jgi:hypothetical protein